MNKKSLQRYNCPEVDVIEITEKYGVMQNIGNDSTTEDLSRTANHHDDDDADLSRRQRTVWEEDEEQ